MINAAATPGRQMDFMDDFQFDPVIRIRRSNIPPREPVSIQKKFLGNFGISFLAKGLFVWLKASKVTSFKEMVNLLPDTPDEIMEGLNELVELKLYVWVNEDQVKLTRAGEAI